MITDINNICIHCRLFILFKAGILLTKIYPDFVLAIKTIIIVNNDLEYYRYTDNSSYFCKSYYNIIVEKKLPKFRSANYINVLPYQKYLDIFNDLILIKKVFIACTHFVMSIINLRPSKICSTTVYY